MLNNSWLEKYGIPEGDLLTRYKYYPALGYEDAPNVNLRAITDFELYYANPSKFNDPFDCLPILNRGNEEATKHRLDELLEINPNALKIFQQRKPDLAEATYQELYESATSEMVEKTSSLEYLRTLIEQFKVLCLTRDPINMLMWSHYGNKHTGFALEFTLDPDLPKEGNLAPLRVQYNPARRHLDDRDFANDMMLFKNPVWKYEKEDRVVLSGRSGVEKYNPKLLTSVILGACIDEIDENTIRSVVTDTNNNHSLNVTVYKVKMSDESYDLHIPDHPYFEHAETDLVS